MNRAIRQSLGIMTSGRHKPTQSASIRSEHSRSRQAHLSMTRYAASRRQTKAHRAAQVASEAKYICLSRCSSCYSLFSGYYTDDTDDLYNISHCVHFIGGRFFCVIYELHTHSKSFQIIPRVYITICVIHNSCILSSSVFVFADSSANKKILFIFFLLFLMLIVGCLSVDCQFACQL